jgi:hypothetical protein
LAANAQQASPLVLTYGMFSFGQYRKSQIPKNQPFLAYF